MKIAKWGNSYAVRIPADVMRRARLENGVELEASVEDGCIFLKPKRSADRAARLDAIAAAVEPGVWEDYAFDRDELHER